MVKNSILVGLGLAVLSTVFFVFPLGLGGPDDMAPLYPGGSDLAPLGLAGNDEG